MAFLWSGDPHTTNQSLIAWSDLCKPRKAGGLGLRDIHIWNTAFMGKHTLAIAAKKENLWIKWIHSVYIKDRDWWNYNPPKDVSWYWKRICGVKDIMASVYTRNEFYNFSIFSVNKAYMKMQGEARTWRWSDCIWNRLSIPKHCFCTWLAAKQRLKTRDTLTKQGICTDDRCLFCSAHTESHEHLFFSCSFISQILEWFSSMVEYSLLYSTVQSILVV